MPTTTFRRLLLALIIGSGLWVGSAGAAAATAPSTVAPVPSAPAGTPSTTAPIVTTPRPPNPDDGLQAEDVREWIEDNVILIIVVAGVLLLIVLWKYVSRPRKNKF